MQDLDVRVVPVYHEDVESDFTNMTSKALDSAMNKYISPKIEVKRPDELWKKPVKSILKWQLYYHKDDMRIDAIRLLNRGIKASMEAKVLKGKEECCLSEFRDKNNDWCCLRIEFLTRYYLEFKRIMCDMIDSYGCISLTTV